MVPCTVMVLGDRRTGKSTLLQKFGAVEVPQVRPYSVIRVYFSFRFLFFYLVVLFMLDICDFGLNLNKL